MSKAITLFILLLLSSRMMGQIDYLEPVDNFTANKHELNGYYRNVFSLLHTGFSKQPFARYAALPSFSPEYALSVEMRGGKHCIVSNTLSKNSWQAESIKINTRTRTIGKPLYQALGELARFTLEQIQDIDGSTAGFDGISYYFSSTDSKGKIQTGQKWSPDRKTLMGRLVQVYEWTYALSIDKQLSESLIVNESRTLLKELHTRAKTHPTEYQQPKYAGLFTVGVWQCIGSGKEPETLPRFANGSLESYVKSRLSLLTTLSTKSDKGYALCQFTLTKEGEISNPIILKCSLPEWGKEALRLTRSLPQAIPAMQQGVPVECNYTLYVPFRPRK